MKIFFVSFFLFLVSNLTPVLGFEPEEELSFLLAEQYLFPEKVVTSGKISDLGGVSKESHFYEIAVELEEDLKLKNISLKLDDAFTNFKHENLPTFPDINLNSLSAEFRSVTFSKNPWVWQFVLRFEYGEFAFDCFGDQGKYLGEDEIRPPLFARAVLFLSTDGKAEWTSYGFDEACSYVELTPLNPS